MAARTSPASTTVAPASVGRWRAAVLVATWLWVALSTTPASVVAAEPANGLDRPIVDVAVIDRGADRWPDLLTLDQPEGGFGAMRLGLLRRDGSWSTVAEKSVTPTSTLEGGGIPWIVDLGGGRFAVVAASWGQPRTLVQPVEVPPTAGADAIRLGTPVILEMRATDAGAADVDGDGTTELVVAGSRTGDALERCAETTFEVLAGDDLEERMLSYEFAERRLGGAVLGEWDGRPGTDLLANMYDTCPADPDAGEAHHLLGIRLRDGSTIVDVATPPDEEHWPMPPPLAIDVDGDGRDEAILTTGSGLAIVDPEDRWRSLPVAEGNVTPLAALRATAGPPTALVAWVALADSPIDSALWTRRIAREDGVLRVVGTTGQPLSDLALGVLEPARERSVAALQEQQAPLVWTADLDGDGCLELHAPALDVDCLGAGPVRRGSPWHGTRPLGAIGPPDDRRLLMALGLEWSPYRWGPLPPSPAAAGAPGAWRHPFTTWFTIAEVPAPVGGTASSVPVPDPVVDTTVDADGRMSLEAPAGTRLLLRVEPIMVWDGPISPEPGLTETFLYGDQREQEFVGMFRVLDATGVEPFEIRAMSTDFSGVPADRWLVTMMALDAHGDVSDPVSALAVYDVTAPPISMDAPFLTAPWPFDAALAGTSEAGASVRIGDGPAVTVDGSGAFQVRTPLAPWPQTIEVTAVDRHGNATPLRVSVMGGVDLRQLPWPAIAAAAVLLAVFLSAIRGSRGARPIAIDADAVELGDGPMIEELDGGPLRRRD